jgi:hypothetical protein
MIDALLFAVRDGIRAAGFGYGEQTCDIQPTGEPPPGMGNIYVAVHSGSSNSISTRNLDETFGFNVTLTMKISVPQDRVGTQLEASKLARVSGKGNPSFMARVEQLRGFLHMNWPITVLMSQTPPSANDNIATWSPLTQVYGFITPAKYAGREDPSFAYSDWFNTVPSEKPLGLKCEMRFENARRMQPQTLPVGPFG